MANQRKGWEQLSPAYRQRLERQHIGKQAYESGESIRAARGHSITPERLSGYVGRARALGIDYVAPEFDEYLDALEPEERIEIARDYVQGYMTPGHPRKGTKRWISRREARLNFQSWLLDVRGGEFSREDWRAYRALYLAHFGGRNA